MPQISALVLGGGHPNDPLVAGTGVPVKALLEIAGQPMAVHVLQALQAGGVGQIVYVGAITPELEPFLHAQIPAVGKMLENLQAGLAPLLHEPRVLIATADIPLLSAAAVQDVLARDSGVGLVYPVVPKYAAEAAFVGGKRTYARLREGVFTGGNLFLLEPRLIGEFLPRLEYILDNRKNVLRLAGMFGVGALLKLLVGQLTIDELERTVSRILGVPAKALITEFAEIGFDVDKPEDLALVRQKLS
ncbi:MAG: NTP transferase domain-containing protein [Deinococcales bacterium]